jgi:hypothetical protein
MARIVRIHVTKVDLAFIRDCRAAKQPLVAIEQSYIDPALGKRQCHAASLKASA